MLNYGRLTTQTTEVSMEEKFTAIDGSLMVFRMRFGLEFSKTSNQNEMGHLSIVEEFPLFALLNTFIFTIRF